MNLLNFLKMPDIPKMVASGLASVTLLFSGMPDAQAHWGHLGELAGHGHLVGAALAAAAAVLAATLVIKGRVQADSEQDAAQTDGDEADAPEGEPTDA